MRTFQLKVVPLGCVPFIVVSAQSLGVESLGLQVKKERFEEFDDPLPWQEIALLIAPSSSTNGVRR